MHKLQFITPLLIAVCLPLVVQSQEREPISYERAVELSLGGSHQLKADSYAQEALFRKKRAAAGLRSPQLGVSASYTYMSDDISLDFNNLKPSVGGVLQQLQLPIPPALQEQIFNANWSYTIQQQDFAIVGANLAVPIFTGGKINAANKAARVEMEGKKWNTIQNKGEIYSQLAERYFGLSLALQVEKVRQEVVEGMEKHLSDAIKLEQNGMIARVERLYAEMKLSEARLELKRAKADVSTITTALAGTLGSDISVLPSTSMFMLTKIDGVEVFKDLALSGNPQLKQIEAKENLAREAVKLERADFMPQIAAMGGIDMYNYQLAHFVPRWAVGVGVKLNLFNGLVRENKFIAAKKTVKQIESLTDKAKSEINTLVEKTYNSLTTTSDMLESLNANIAFAKEYLRIKELAFLEGTCPSSDVVDAKLNLAKSRTERLSAAYNYDVYLAHLLEACGAGHLFTEYKNSPNYKSVYYNEEQQ